MKSTKSSSLLLSLLLTIFSTAAAAETFSSPLFGLNTAPNGDLLVADGGAGVVKLRDGSASLHVPLPLVSDVSAIGTSSLWAVRGGTDPRADSGQALLRLSKGNNRIIANLFQFEQANDPDGGPVPDSNPFDVQSLGGGAALVADAGGNDLLRVDNQGNVELLAVFPPEIVSTADLKNLFGGGCPDNPANPFCGLPPAIPAQAVPTSVAVGSDGAYYVGELKGFPAPKNESRIWRVSPGATGLTCPNPDCTLVFDGGFTSIIDLAVGPDGLLYVVELDEMTWFAVEFGLPGAAGGTINACDVMAGTCDEVATGVPIVTAIAFGKDGRLWATRNALIPGAAEVVEIPQ